VHLRALGAQLAHLGLGDLELLHLPHSGHAAQRRA
jgi:hypothetical protein